MASQPGVTSNAVELGNFARLRMSSSWGRLTEKFARDARDTSPINLTPALPCQVRGWDSGLRRASQGHVIDKIDARPALGGQSLGVWGIACDSRGASATGSTPALHRNYLRCFGGFGRNLFRFANRHLEPLGVKGEIREGHSCVEASPNLLKHHADLPNLCT